MRGAVILAGILAEILAVSLVLSLALMGCKVPLSDLTPTPRVIDAVWFAEEATLFVFYELEAEQGLGPDSQLEIRYVTDDGAQPWAPLLGLPQVHPTAPPSCAAASICGVASLTVARPPREVALRLRYHPDGDLTLALSPALYLIDRGPAYTHRSAIVYGVLDAQNRAVQWRLRHHFPNLRNGEVERLGLRRRFEIKTQRFGEAIALPGDDPYGYGVGCPEGATPLGLAPLETDQRAAFHPEDLPPEADAAPVICAAATVLDALGAFTTTAIARKNPQVGPAFPLLRSPVRDASPLKLLLTDCAAPTSSDHERMQRQRLLMGDDPPTLCLDRLQTRLEVALSDRLTALIEAARPEGEDMVLVLALHHDQRALRAAVEAALAPILRVERPRASPRVVGALVLDSYSHEILDADVGRGAIWCPAKAPLPEEDEDPMDINLASVASLACAVLPDDISGLSLGPFSVGALPIFPTRAAYLDFIDQYSEAEAGVMRRLIFRAPWLPPTVEVMEIEPLGAATFFNDEAITAAPEAAFSYCANDEEYAGFVFQVAGVEAPLPLELLPQVHQAAPQGRYPLGLAWEFPFLLRLKYEIVIATAVTAFDASLSLGIGVDASQDYGSTLWGAEAFPLSQTLLQCARFCDHPTFDAAGIYQIYDSFRSVYVAACYAPRYPARGDSGSPLDP
ncbi:hypothetical protein KKF91_19205 [Myxococcota bacterium]|nr:hypothetical protein [Myxococcota bacterium]